MACKHPTRFIKNYEHVNGFWYHEFCAFCSKHLKSWGKNENGSIKIAEGDEVLDLKDIEGELFKEESE